MTVIREGALSFRFAPDVQASRYDEWAFYRNRFQNQCARANKAIDLLCCGRQTTWLVEVKDYRQHARTKPVALADELAQKVRDTLAGLAAGQWQAHVADEKNLARKALRARHVRVVCHLEQPAKATRLRPRAIEPDKLKDQLRRLLKAVDPHPMIVDKATLAPSMPWQVEFMST
jgi:hypothetical protein